MIYVLDYWLTIKGYYIHTHMRICRGQGFRKGHGASMHSPKTTFFPVSRNAPTWKLSNSDLFISMEALFNINIKSMVITWIYFDPWFSTPVTTEKDVPSQRHPHGRSPWWLHLQNNNAIFSTLPDNFEQYSINLHLP